MTHEAQHVRTESDCLENGGCTDDRIENIYQYLDGALGSADLAEVRAHIEGCTTCQSEHDLELIIRDVVKRSCDEKAPRSLKDKIMHRIQELKTTE
ncbi:mycothiol system anti-sigma-R factor [Enteractinococcus helveticum]|uniref:Mycothiol system anti-sigma-R factor n=1 Tax=Enteractinococcus helveticum TaxID=1837282 RepID=A0A1B7M1U3_9MICC|nr:mycothiol system anti-sigma-R factor [Enteractinococcus helveticum]OAV62562.1 mycothiol system anti-sigma-R factor [Enteractinococcus helveticum]